MTRPRRRVMGRIVIFRKYPIAIIGAKDNDGIDGKKGHVRGHV
jgi:hypothetical protein